MIFLKGFFQTWLKVPLIFNLNLYIFYQIFLFKKFKIFYTFLVYMKDCPPLDPILYSPTLYNTVLHNRSWHASNVGSWPSSAWFELLFLTRWDSNPLFINQWRYEVWERRGWPLRLVALLRFRADSKQPTLKGDREIS